MFNNEYKRSKSYFSNSEYSLSDNLDNEVNILLDELKNEFPELIIEDINFADEDENHRESLIKAKNILDKAGYKVINNKLIDPKSNKPVEIEFLLASPNFIRIILPYIKNLKKLGIDAKIKQVDVATYVRRLEDFDFDVATTIFSSSFAPSNELYNYFHSKSADIKGSGNLSGIKNNAVDHLIEEAINTNNINELKLYIKALDKVLLSQYISVPQWHLPYFRFVYWNKFNIPKIQPKYDLGVEYWWQK